MKLNGDKRDAATQRSGTLTKYNIYIYIYPRRNVGSAVMKFAVKSNYETRERNYVLTDRMRTDKRITAD